MLLFSHLSAALIHGVRFPCDKEETFTLMMSSQLFLPVDWLGFSSPLYTAHCDLCDSRSHTAHFCVTAGLGLAQVNLCLLILQLACCHINKTAADYNYVKAVADSRMGVRGPCPPPTLLRTTFIVPLTRNKF